MIVIKPDQTRRVEIPGVPDPVRRPVDIDQSLTGFTSLRTLRVYRFEKDSIIEGHAEEDEVYVIVLAGSIDLTVEVSTPQHTFGPVTLSATNGNEGSASVAYLPPGAAYKLISKVEADVAYARATPSGIRSPEIFSSVEHIAHTGVSILLENTTYAERLRFRLARVDAQQACVSFSPVDEPVVSCEQLIHLKVLAPAASAVVTIGYGSTRDQIESWDTIAVAPGERPILEFEKGSVWLLLVVMAV